MRGPLETELHHKCDRQHDRRGETSVQEHELGSEVLAALSSAPVFHLGFNSDSTEVAESPSPHVNLAKGYEEEKKSA